MSQKRVEKKSQVTDFVHFIHFYFATQFYRKQKRKQKI